MPLGGDSNAPASELKLTWALPAEKRMAGAGMLDHPFYRFTREINDEEPITTRFPEATLDLINAVTP